PSSTPSGNSAGRHGIGSSFDGRGAGRVSTSSTTAPRGFDSSVMPGERSSETPRATGKEAQPGAAASISAMTPLPNRRDRLNSFAPLVVRSGKDALADDGVEAKHAAAMTY